MTRPLILLADDDELLRAIVEHKLERAGYDVMSVEDGSAVLRAVQSHPPAALILDAMMPVIDGFEVLRRLSSDPILAALPIVMLSALKREEDIVEALKIGATDYLVKPFNPDELVLRLSRLLSAKTRDTVRSVA